jgi:hypothetical protein
MGDVYAFFQPSQPGIKVEAQWGRGDIKLSPCFYYGYTINNRLDCLGASVCHQDARINALGALCLGKDGDMVFNAAHNWGIIFVDM